MDYLAFGLIVAMVLVFSTANAADCEINDHQFNVGETYQPKGKCTQATCKSPGLILTKGCPSENTLKPCQFIPEDTSKPYPQCCPKWKC